MSKPSKLMRNGKLKKKGIRAWKPKEPTYIYRAKLAALRA